MEGYIEELIRICDELRKENDNEHE